MAPVMAGERPPVGEPATAQDAAMGPAGRVVAPRVTDLDDPPPLAAQAETEVDVLGAEEIAVVEATDLVESDAPDELTGTDRELHVPCRGRARHPAVGADQADAPRQLAA